MKKMIFTKRLMQGIPVLSAIFLFLVLGVLSSHAVSQERRIVVKVTNPILLDRQEMIALRWKDLRRVIPALSQERLFVYDVQTHDTLVSQWIDEDLDGVPEELLFRSDVKGRETKWFVVQECYERVQPFPSITFARLMIPREDLAWENDRNAFRIYGPPLAQSVRNGFDVWTKRVPYPIIEKWYAHDEAPEAARISYHEDHGEGADFFNVGKTLGAGGTALLQGDSLVQSGVFHTYKIITSGPIRAQFEVTYKAIEVNGGAVIEKKKITLDAGSNMNKVEITYSSPGLKGKVPFVVGLVKRNGVSMSSDKTDRWVSLWGLTNDHAENGSLGTAMVMTKESYAGMKEDSVHVFLTASGTMGVPSIYYTGAAWTRSGHFLSEPEWNSYVRSFALRLDSPLQIAIIP